MEILTFPLSRDGTVRKINLELLHYTKKRLIGFNIKDYR